MKWTALVALLTIAGCGGEKSDPDRDAACDAQHETYEIALEAWHVQFGTVEQPDRERLIADTFLAADDPEGYAVIVNDSVEPGPRCD